MLQAFIITLREGVEAALIVGITLAYLNKIGRTDLRKAVYAALGAAFLGSIGVAIVISTQLDQIRPQPTSFAPRPDLDDLTGDGLAGPIQIRPASRLVFLSRIAMTGSTALWPGRSTKQEVLSADRWAATCAVTS